MTVMPSHDEVAELLGAYALDAVDPAEAALVEAHLAECPRCRDELAGYREVAGVLAFGGASAPDGLWGRIAVNLATAPPAPELARLYPLRQRRPSIRIGVVAAVAAVAASVVLGLALQIRSQGRELNGLKRVMATSSLDAAFHGALLDPTASSVRLVSPDGRVRVAAVVQANGTGYLLGTNLPVLAANRTYQLWSVLPDRKLSLGLLGPRPDVVPFHASTHVAALAVTDELAPGVVTSEQKPVVVGYARQT